MNPVPADTSVNSNKRTAYYNGGIVPPYIKQAIKEHNKAKKKQEAQANEIAQRSLQQGNQDKTTGTG